ncbi:MAG: leucine-rich repeat domain-containing protein [Bacteroidales bacterium]|nr:leucine-rich repeat domain-containing protein [Bacteroidales bacterium]
MKRLVLFICTLLCANVLSAQTEFIVGNLKYTLSDSNPTKVSVGAADTTIITANISATVTYQGTTYDVTSIGNWGFAQCGRLTSVDIPSSVTSIGEESFCWCSSLISVDIPNSVTSIGMNAFWYCSSLTSVDIPNSVISIGHQAFTGCSSLTSITIPNSINYIQVGTFANCSSLTSITIPNSVTEICGGSGLFGAFENCSSLTSVTIGENVTSIGNYAFNGCSLLQNVTCLATNPPILYNNSFPYPNIATLNVPCGSLEAYSAPTSYWNMLFTDRIEEDCSGLEDAEFAELSVYPNPTRGKVTFNQAIEKVEVIDLSGKTLFTFSNANSINIESLPSGDYYLRLTNNDKAIMQKIIKE